MKKAFTLVELLVVISIMAILTIVTVSQFRTARKRANDVARKGDLNAVAKALQLYFADYGVMPEAEGGQIKTNEVRKWGEEFKDSTGYIYMVKLPTENTDGWPQYCYQTDDSRKKYALFAKLEVSSDGECEGNNYICNEVGGYCYANVSPNTSVEEKGNFPGESAPVIPPPSSPATSTPIPTAKSSPSPSFAPATSTPAPTSTPIPTKPMVTGFVSPVVPPGNIIDPQPTHSGI